MDNTAKTTEEKKSGWSSRIRIISLILVILFVGELVLAGFSSRVNFSVQEYTGTPYEFAADYIGENDEYLTADRLRRMIAATRLLGTPKTYDELSLFASVAIAEKDYRKAIDYLNSCAELFEGDDAQRANIYLKIGCLWALLSQWEEAAAEFEKTIRLNPEDSTACIMLCEACINTGEYEKALAALEQYGTFGPYTDEQKDALIQLYLALNRSDEALAECDRLLADDATGLSRGDLQYYKAQALFQKNDYAAARLCAEQCGEDSTYANEALGIVAVCCAALEDYDGAYRAYSALLDNGVTDFDLYDQAVRNAYLAENFPAILRLCEDAFQTLGHNEQTDALKRWLGIAQMETGDYTSAEENFTERLKNGERLPELFYLRGLCRMASSNFDGALKDFTMALSSEEIKDKALYNRGLCYLSLNDNDSAARDFQTVILRNADPEALQLTADLLEMSEEDLKAVRDSATAATVEATETSD